jgi:hypothetical protein
MTTSLWPRGIILPRPLRLTRRRDRHAKLRAVTAYASAVYAGHAAKAVYMAAARKL